MRSIPKKPFHKDPSIRYDDFMIQVTFTYRGASELRSQTYFVESVPLVGDAVSFANSSGQFVVLEVSHVLSATAPAHQVQVFYGDRK